MRLGVLLFATTFVLVACKSERRLTEADCKLVKDRVQQAWHRDAIAAQRLADTDAYRAFIRDEGERIGTAVEKACSESVGRTVDAREIDCMSKADTIDDVYACAK